ILVLLVFAAGQRQAAEILHVPLGALGFLLSCTAALLLLGRYGKRAEEPAAVPAALAEHDTDRLPKRALLLSFPVLFFLFLVSLQPKALKPAGELFGQSSHSGHSGSYPLPFSLDELSQPPYALRFSELPLSADEESLFRTRRRAGQKVALFACR